MKTRVLFFLCLLFLVGVAISTQRTRTASAQESDKAKTAMALRKGFEEVSGWVLKSAEMIPEEKYDYRPVDTVRTFGQIVGHITDSYNFYCARAGGNRVQWADPAEKGKINKETLIPKLKEATDKCNAAYGADSAEIQPLLENVAHTNLHYGNLITYLRMMGMKPPSS